MKKRALLNLAATCVFLSAAADSYALPDAVAAVPCATATSFRLPLDGDWKPSRKFGGDSPDWWGPPDHPNESWCGLHLAHDVPRTAKTSIFACAAGCIVLAEPIVGIGYAVHIDHTLPDGSHVVSIYYHLLPPGLSPPDDGGVKLTVGTAVTKGQIIGKVSSRPEDYGSGPHLHFGIRPHAYKTGCDSRSHKWYYPGYTGLYVCGKDCCPSDPQFRQCDKSDPNHAAIAAEWVNPHSFVQEHQEQTPSCPNNDLAITWGAATNEIISGAATAANGDIYVCATASGSRLLLSRFDKTGALVWSKSYTFGVVVNPSSLTVAPDGNVIVSAYIETRYVDGLLMKVDPDGNKVWATTWGSGAWDPGGKHVTDAQGNTYQHISSTGRAGAIDGVLLKYDAAGNLKWQRGWYRNINNSDFEIALDKDGNVLLSGFTGGWTDPSGQDLQVQKWDPDGNLLWDRVWVGAGTEHGTALTADEVGNVYVGGFTTGFGLGGDDCFVMKFSPTGSPLWQKAWGKSGTDQLESICVGPDGVIYAVGTTTSFGNGNDLLLLRYAMDGSMLSEQIWSTGGNEQATAIHGSADGCFLIGGSAPHCSGTWTDVVGTGGTPSGTFLSNQGSVVTPVGTSMAVAPTIASYAGVQCSGGGGQDGLILAFQGPSKPTNSAQAIVIEQAQSPQGKVLEGDVPSMFEMVNYPNPFNAATEISYSLASDSHVKIEVYDILGRRVAVLTDERQSAGPHRITWTGNDSSGRGLASGVYFYRLSASGSVQAKKMVLLK